MKMKKALGLLILLFTVVIFTACGSGLVDHELVGTWQPTDSEFLTVFNADGTGVQENSFSSGEFLFYWSIEDGVVTQFRDASRSETSQIDSWEYYIEGDILTRSWDGEMDWIFYRVE